MTDLETIPVYLDCDTGVDDAVAIAYLAASPHAELVGVGTVSGNVPATIGARNSQNLLALLGSERVPVAVGAAAPLDRPYRGGAGDVHGLNGIGNVDLPMSQSGQEHSGSAVDLLGQLARKYPGSLRVVATGPLTNLAHALREDPEIAALVHSVTLMGGAALVPGNITAVAEANIANDPSAAHQVLRGGWDVTLVPLDVTMDHRIDVTHLDQLRGSGQAANAALADMLEFYFGFYASRFGKPSCPLHDPLAVAVAIGSVTLREAPVVDVDVDYGDGPGRGQTICDLRGMYSGYRDQGPESSTGQRAARVVLSIEEDFATDMITTLCKA